MDLLDSNILIYAVQPGHEFLDAWITSEAASVSAISIPEVLGFPELREDDESIFAAWFARLHVREVTAPILWKAAELRRQRRMKLGDSIIAATALLAGANLVTRNVNDFKHIAGLPLFNPFAANAGGAATGEG
jgi:predicted nucleic acid-binding protein